MIGIKVCCCFVVFVLLFVLDFMNVSLTTDLRYHNKNESIFVVEDCDRSIHHPIIK